MPQALGGNAGHGLTWEDLEKLEGYIARARTSVKPERDELKAIVQLQRAARKAAEGKAFKWGAFPPPGKPPPDKPGLQMSDLYGNHRIIPDDWKPSEQTVVWMVGILQAQGIAFDIDWLIAEFVTFWRSRAKAMASWQQCFRNNILQKLARGIPLAPPTRAEPGRPRRSGGRIFDRAAELRNQRLADFDREAGDIAGQPSRPRPPANGALGQDD